MSIDLNKIMLPNEMDAIGVSSMTSEQCQELAVWGLRMYSLGQQTIADIDEIKYDGRLIILDDDSRWEVDSTDAYTADSWSSFSKVLVLDDTMYNLDAMEKVEVQAEG